MYFTILNYRGWLASIDRPIPIVSCTNEQEKGGGGGGGGPPPHPPPPPPPGSAPVIACISEHMVHTGRCRA